MKLHYWSLPLPLPLLISLPLPTSLPHSIFPSSVCMKFYLKNHTTLYNRIKGKLERKDPTETI